MLDGLGEKCICLVVVLALHSCLHPFFLPVVLIIGFGVQQRTLLYGALYVVGLLCILLASAIYEYVTLVLIVILVILIRLPDVNPIQTNSTKDVHVQTTQSMNALEYYVQSPIRSNRQESNLAIHNQQVICEAIVGFGTLETKRVLQKLKELHNEEEAKKMAKRYSSHRCTPSRVMPSGSFIRSNRSISRSISRSKICYGQSPNKQRSNLAIYNQHIIDEAIAEVSALEKQRVEQRIKELYDEEAKLIASERRKCNNMNLHNL